MTRKEDRIKGIGVIDGDKRNRCKWFTEEMSRNMSSETLDTELDRTMKERDEIDKALDVIFDVFTNKDLTGKNTKRMIKGYFLRNDNGITHFFSLPLGQS